MLKSSEAPTPLNMSHVGAQYVSDTDKDLIRHRYI